MTGRRGYALRGSDAMTGAHQRGRLRRERFRAGTACGQTGTQQQVYHAGAYVPAAKKRRKYHYDIEQERKEDFVCFSAAPAANNTVTRLKWLAAMAVDPEAKRWMLGLARKIDIETGESWYEAFYHHLRREME